MSTSEDLHRLEAELESHQQDLREDAARINQKIEETKAQLSPTNFVRQRAAISIGVAFVLGAMLEFFLGRRDLQLGPLADPAVRNVGTPAARMILANAARTAATDAILR